MIVVQSVTTRFRPFFLTHTKFKNLIDVIIGVSRPLPSPNSRAASSRVNSPGGNRMAGGSVFMTSFLNTCAQSTTGCAWRHCCLLLPNLQGRLFCTCLQRTLLDGMSQQYYVGYCIIGKTCLPIDQYETHTDEPHRE